MFMSKINKFVITVNIPTLTDESYGVGANKEVRMSLKPRSQNGVIFSVTDTPSGDFMSMEMVNGTVSS